MAITIRDGKGTTGKEAIVNSDGRVSVNFPSTPATAGYVSLALESDSGSVTGSRVVRPAKVTEASQTIIATSNVLFQGVFPGTTIDTGQYFSATSNMTIAQGGGMLMLNSTDAVTNGYYAVVNTYKTFTMIPGQNLYCQFRLAVTNSAAVDKIMEVGLGFASTTSTPTDGAFFRWGSDGTLKAVVNNNGSEVGTVSTAITQKSDGEFHYYLVSVAYDRATFWIDDTCVALITVPTTTSQITRSSAYPFFARVYCTGTASAGPVLMLGQVTVDSAGGSFERTFPHTAASWGAISHQAPSSTWTTLGTQSNWTNSPTIGAATISATAVPSGGYTGTTLGGLFNATAQATGVTSANIFFAWLNPQGRATVVGRNLYITDIAIAPVNAGATVASTPTVIQWLLGYNSTAVTLATAEAATTNIARFLPLGISSWVVGSLAGTSAPPIIINFQTPIPVWSGHYLHILGRFLVGTATGSQTIWGSCLINGYWD